MKFDRKLIVKKPHPFLTFLIKLTLKLRLWRSKIIFTILKKN